MGAKAGRLILPSVVVMSSYGPGEGRGYRVTGVLLPYLLEQMVSAGALEVYIADAWRYADTIADIPESIRSYVHISDVAKRAQNVSDAFFDNIFGETGIIYKHGAYSLELNNSDAKPVMAAHSGLTLFLEAFFLKAHIHFNIDTFVVSLQKTLMQLRSSDNRIKVASLIAALSVYKSVEIASPNVISTEPAEKARRLGELILTEEYRALSKLHFGLGALRSPGHIIDRIELQLQKLLSLTSAKAVINYTSKAASVAAGAPVPDSQLVESFVHEGFLPTAIDLTAQIQQAMTDFEEMHQDIDQKARVRDGMARFTLPRLSTKKLGL
ncbi:hypothetical protein [Methylosinus sporium]|nr:hypothetical protein [Methylosinus sporium]